jgi:hypothetical protein
MADDGWNRADAAPMIISDKLDEVGLVFSIERLFDVIYVMGAAGNDREFRVTGCSEQIVVRPDTAMMLEVGRAASNSIKQKSDPLGRGMRRQ